jgi:hypothetical protein
MICPSQTLKKLAMLGSYEKPLTDACNLLRAMEKLMQRSKVEGK